VQIFQLDIEGLFNEMLTNPGAYGFTNTTGTALVGNTPAPNQDEYVFWDDIHPTRVAHGIIGNVAADLAVTHAWVSTQPGGNWATAGNWDPAGVPAADWIAHVVNDNIPSAQAVAVAQNSSVQHVLVRGDTGAMTLIVQSAAELSAASISVAQQGRISLQGGTISVTTLSVGAGGALGGTGVVAGNVTNAGVVAPGEPGSTLHIDGSFTQASTGRIEIDLGGTGSGLHDVLEIEGGATLAGALAVRLEDNFVALPGQSFLSITFASRAGDVTVVNETGYAGLTFEKAYTPTSLTLLADALFDGDANLDARVNLNDFNILAANFGASGVSWLMGDFTGDGNVNLADFNVLAANFGLAARTGPLGAGDWAALASAVPEPAAAWVVGLATFLARRGRRLGPSDADRSHSCVKSSKKLFDMP
jgi:hypothetical protein